jgi:hypothetical protein
MREDKIICEHLMKHSHTKLLAFDFSTIAHVVLEHSKILALNASHSPGLNFWNPRREGDVADEPRLQLDPSNKKDEVN